MKSTPPTLTALLLIVSTSLAGAAPWSFFRRTPEPPRQEERHDSRNDRRDRDSRYDNNHRHDGRRPIRVEARAQQRLRELGFYRGPVDGEFGRGSRAALSRFQHSRGLRPTGVLNESTMRALRI